MAHQSRDLRNRQQYGVRTNPAPAVRPPDVQAAPKAPEPSTVTQPAAPPRVEIETSKASETPARPAVTKPVPQARSTRSISPKPSTVEEPRFRFGGPVKHVLRRDIAGFITVSKYGPNGNTRHDHYFEFDPMTGKVGQEILLDRIDDSY